MTLSVTQVIDVYSAAWFPNSDKGSSESVEGGCSGNFILSRSVFLDETRKTTTDLSQDGRCLSRNPNLVLPN
jgi:hypothetical protein